MRREAAMHLTSWHAEPGTAFGTAFATHLHGRDLEVVVEAIAEIAAEPAGASAGLVPGGPLDDVHPHRWHWKVTSPHGTLLADGYAASRDAAELAAEDEATAVHPPTPELLDRLLG
jgi:hypothetical protein